MRVEIGSYTILYSYFKFRKLPIGKRIKTRIAKDLSRGIKYGQFHKSFDGVTDELGWWAVQE